MNYKGLQIALRNYRDNGYKVNCKLNEKKEVLQKEFDRLQKLRNTKQNGYILWRGISPIDGLTPVKVVATGFTIKSKNGKTGDMIQVWIMLDNVHPKNAIDSGDDYAICGNCPHRKNERGERSCYVGIHTIGQIYKKDATDGYIDISNNIVESLHLFQDKDVRFGSYGDPVCIPLHIVELITKVCGHTGYTHQWRNPKFSAYKQYFHASVDTFSDYFDAKDSGWSTFRVRSQESTVMLNDEVYCQGGLKTTCKKCQLCSGTSSQQSHILIDGHGSGSKYITKERTQMTR